MRFIHIADVHLGARPDAGTSYTSNREREIWKSLSDIVDICEEEQVDLLLIAGDLFHRQPLLRELKEVDSLFLKLTHTQVVLSAGNHDYLKKDSYYYTFSWNGHVHMILSETLTRVNLPQIGAAVSGFSYTAKENVAKPYLVPCKKDSGYAEILMVHGGDEKHVPVRREELLHLGYDYVALGHIHKPQIIEENRVAYAGALEPIDKNDTGSHGYIRGEIIDGKCHIAFVPFAKREYIHETVWVSGNMSGNDLRVHIRNIIEERGTQNIYKITLKGFRDPDILFDLQAMDAYGNILEIIDDTKPAYDFAKLKRTNEGNILGKFIEQFANCDAESIQYRAMCEGVRALLETRQEE